MTPIYQRVAIIGIGLIGGSVGLAARKRGLAEQVVGYSRSEATRRLAVERGAVDQVTDNALAAVHEADLVYIATPVGAIPQLIEELSAVLDVGCTVTDAGSVKTEICRAGNRFLPASFIGGHPIAGSERSGVAAASADLFIGRSYVSPPLIPTRNYWPASLLSCTPWGPIRTPPPPRTTMPWSPSPAISPTFGASALALTLARTDGAANLAPFAGGGLRDTTRIAASDPKLWQEIFEANRRNLLAGCAAATEAFTALRRAVAEDDPEALIALLEQAKQFRDELTHAGGPLFDSGGAEMSSQGLRLAIDGPAGAGKSTVARDVARELGYVFIDTGAMYRAVAHFVMQADLTVGKDDDAIGELAGKLRFEFRPVGEQRHLFVNDEDVEAVVRLPEVGRLSSPVSAIPLVRHNLLVAQREMATGGGVVMEGRDSAPWFCPRPR